MMAVVFERDLEARSTESERSVGRAGTDIHRRRIMGAAPEASAVVLQLPGGKITRRGDPALAVGRRGPESAEDAAEHRTHTRGGVLCLRHGVLLSP
jgi:hypothetical protein